MANSKQILQKLARNAKTIGLTVNSESQSAVVIENGSNDLTIGYVDASFSPSVVGGVDASVSPFLGIGVGAPGKIRIKSASNAAGTIADVMDSAVAAQVLALCSSMANDLRLENSDASFSADLRGHSDLLGMGQ
jgi:hypothetical protein